MRRFVGATVLAFPSLQSPWDYIIGATRWQRFECSQQGAVPIGTTSDTVVAVKTEKGGVVDKKQAPMETLTHVFKTHPSALRLHRELTICLANGESEKAADLASVLAKTVKRVVDHACDRPWTTTQEASAAPNFDSDAKRENSEDHVPFVGEETLNFVLEKTRRSLSSQEDEKAVDIFVDGQSGTSTPSASQSLSSVDVPFWKQPSALRLTLLEASFEMTLPEISRDDDVDNPLSRGNAQLEEHESKWMGILDEYLIREKDRWNAQKKSVGRALLTTAQRLGISPMDLHVALEECGGMRPADGNGDGRLRVLKHCNLIVRGEVPEVMEWLVNGSNGDLQTKVAEELEALAHRMESRGSPMSPKDREMALFELMMMKSKMRYVVGLHRELQVALDKSEALNTLPHQQGCSSGSEVFVQHAVERLNKIAPDGSELNAEDVELIQSLSTPVLPFTFMLKMCLWFETPLNR